jgi:transposase
MKYIALNDEIIEELKIVVKTDARHKSRKRAQAFLLNAKGVKIPEIAKIIDISQRSLYRWFDRFDNRDINSIHELVGRGRKPLLNIKEHSNSVRIHIKKSII